MNMTTKILVQGDFSDLQIGDGVLTSAIGSRDGIPGVVVEVSADGCTVCTPHLGVFGRFANRAAIVFVERGGAYALAKALRRASKAVAEHDGAHEVMREVRRSVEDADE